MYQTHGIMGSSQGSILLEMTQAKIVIDRLRSPAYRQALFVLEGIVEGCILHVVVLEDQHLSRDRVDHRLPALILDQVLDIIRSVIVDVGIQELQGIL